MVLSVWPEFNASAAGVRVYSIIEILKRAGWKVVCVSPATYNEAASLLAKREITVASLIPPYADHQLGWPVYDSSQKPALRSYPKEQRLHALKSGQADVSNVPEAVLKVLEQAQDSSGAQTQPEGWKTTIDAVLSDHKPNLVWFERFIMEEMFGWRVQELLPEALRMLDTQDLHFLREAREGAVRDMDVLHAELAEQQREHGLLGLAAPVPSFAFTAPLYLSHPLMGLDASSDDVLNVKVKRELASILRSDLTAVVSTHELELLRKEFRVPSEKLCLSSFYFPYARLRSIIRSGESLDPVSATFDAPGSKTPWFGTVSQKFDHRKDFVSIGHFRHRANVDSLRVLKQYLWPEIRDRLMKLGQADARLYVFGAYPSSEHMKMHDPKQGFFMIGPAKDARRELSKYRVLLAPLRFGAGASTN